MENNNNQMPKINNNSGGSDSPSEVKSNSLGVPSHKQEDVVPKQVIQNADSINSSDVKISKVSRNGIKVIATRPGFYGQQRIKTGQEFIVRNENDLGSWMTCIDPVMEQERVKKMKVKKANS